MFGKTRETAPRPRRPAKLAILFVVSVRIFLWFADPPNDAHLPSGPGADLVAASFAARDCSRSIVLMGSSRLLYGLDEKQLARALNLSEDVVVNTSLNAAGPWDFRRQMELAADAPCFPRVVVADLAWWMFNANRQATVSERFFPLASIDDRLRVESAFLRATSLLDWILGDRRHRRTLVDWGFAFTRPLPPPWHSTPRPLWTEAAAARQRAAREWMVESTVDRLLSSPEFSERDFEDLERFVQLLHRRCSTVVLLHTPTKAEYRGKLQGTERGREFERIYRSRVLSKEHTGADEIVVVESVESLGLDEHVFVDYGHLSPDGARRLTQYVASRLREHRSSLSGGPCAAHAASDAP